MVGACCILHLSLAPASLGLAGGRKILHVAGPLLPQQLEAMLVNGLTVDAQT